MRGNDTSLGDDGCPWGVAQVADEQPFFGRPNRCDVFVEKSHFACGHSEPVHLWAFTSER